MKQLVPLLLCACVGVICYFCAKKRGRNPNSWFVLGLFFGIFGLVALLIMPPLNRRRRIDLEKPAQPLSLEVIDPSHTSKLWYYLDPSNQQFGPMSLQNLTNAWRDGKVSGTTYVWNDVMENWKRFEEVLRSKVARCTTLEKETTSSP